MWIIYVNVNVNVSIHICIATFTRIQIQSLSMTLMMIQMSMSDDRVCDRVRILAENVPGSREMYRDQEGDKER